MTKIYMLTFDNLAVPREALLRFLDGRAEVSNWHASTVQNLVFLVSDRTGEELSRVLKEEGGINTFVLSEVDNSIIGRQLFGWLPGATWDFIQRKSAQPQLSMATTS